jgi:DNA-binding LacI/PurR family transcriptional regulator
VVLASRDLPGLPADTVVVDNVSGGRLAVEHLAGHGHRRIGLIAGPDDIRPFVHREEGFRDEMSDRGLTVHEDTVVHVESTIDEGYRAMTRLLDAPSPPTAVFVSSDELALGALDALAERGMRLPEDVAVVGFDNIAFGARTRVPLTTVDSHAHELGRVAAELLLERIETGREAEPVRRVLAPRLVRRLSCGCAPVPPRRSE